MKSRMLFFIECMLIGAILFLVSCNHKELIYEQSSTTQVQVIFDWTKSPGAVVTGMSLWLFPDIGGLPLRYEFPGHKGGMIDVPRGKFNVVCMNNNSEVLQYRNLEEWRTFEVFTRRSSQLEPFGLQRNVDAANPEGDPPVLVPDIFWSDHKSDQIFNSKAKADTLILYPQDQLCTYTVEVKNVQNLKYVSAVCASLSGLSGSFFPCTGELSASRSLLPFVCSSDTDSLIKGNFLTFGLSTHIDKSHRLALYMILVDGSKFYQMFDVTSQVNSTPDNRNVFIMIDSIVVPTPIVNGNGFQPSVEDWEIINENINM